MSRLMDTDLLGGRDHPTITFKSTRVEALDPAHWKVTGDLTIHGGARPVVLDTRYLGQAKHPFSGKMSFLGWGGILLGILAPVGRGLGEVLFLEALNERISSAFRATVISMANLGIRASFCLLGPLVGYGIDRSGLPSVLSALGILFSIAFVVLLLPLVVRERSLSPVEGVTQ
jgi:hypothetical protein